MLKTTLLLGTIVLLAACGRTGTYEDGLANIKVGLTSQVDPVTQDHVTRALDGFEFELYQLADKPVCSTASPCVWWAEGVMPSSELKYLSGYGDGTLTVVSVHKTGPDGSKLKQNPLAPR